MTQWTLAARAEKMNPSVIREILKVTEKPGIISLAGGLPSPKTFPISEFAEAAAAILNNDGGSLTGCKIYVALFPCNECAKAIIQSGIKEVLYLSDKYGDTPSVQASKRMFKAAGVACTKITMEHDEITIDFREENI